jgi:hypothetical protein
MQGNLTRKELRDHFAAEAMNGLVVGVTDRLTRDAQKLAQRTFNIADAMLQESDRAVPQQPEVSGPSPYAIPDN